MNNEIRYFILMVFIIFQTSSNAMASNRLVNCTFEEGTYWNYNNYFNLSSGYLANNWSIVSEDSKSGSFCARSASVPSGTGGWPDSPVFHYGRDIGWGGEIFIRWWEKHPSDFNPDGLEGHNRIRIGHSNEATWAPDGAEVNYGWFHIYNTGVYWPSIGLYRDNQWHEIAIYIKMPTSASSNNGVISVWRDGNGTYDSGNSRVFHNSAVDINTPWNHFLFGNYYKGAPRGNWTFWIDDIDVWDGIPTGGAPPIPADTTPPYVSNMSPGANAANVAINSNIIAHVRDSGSGVASTSITMSVNGQSVSPVITGSEADYILTYNPPVDFSYSSVVSVTINARDLNGNVMAPYTYTFTTQAAPDTTAPAAPIGITTTIIQ